MTTPDPHEIIGGSSVLSTDRLSLRTMLALLLAGSAILFFIGISFERDMTVPPTPAAVDPSAEPAAAPVEGAGEEAGHSPGATGEASGEAAGEHATETWPLGLDLEAPPLVGGIILVSLILAVVVVMTTSPVVLMAVVGFAVLFGLFDLLEVVHQVGRGQAGLVTVALVLLVAHAAAGIIALSLRAARDPAMPSAA